MASWVLQYSKTLCPVKVFCCVNLVIVCPQNLLQRCHSARASYLFQQDKFYDISYDTGDKSIQCSRKPDAFKFWLMWKALGTGELEQRVDRALAMARWVWGNITGLQLKLSGRMAKFGSAQETWCRGLRHYFNLSSCTEWHQTAAKERISSLDVNAVFYQ